MNHDRDIPSEKVLLAEISVLSDDFLDDVASRLTRPELQWR